jgi:hypothetical protein
MCAGFTSMKECFALFRYGARRRRENYSLGEQNLLTPEEIEWVCAKSHAQD